MKKAEPSSASAIRLPDSYWPKLRALMQAKGRAWLMKAIDREYKKLPAPSDTAPPPTP